MGARARLGPVRPTDASRLSCSSVGAGPSWRTPTFRAAARYLLTVSLESPGPRRYVPLAAARLPASDDFCYFHSEHLLVGHRCLLSLKCSYGLRLGAQGGLKTVAKWPKDPGDISVLWPNVPGY